MIILIFYADNLWNTVSSFRMLRNWKKVQRKTMLTRFETKSCDVQINNWACLPKEEKTKWRPDSSLSILEMKS